MHRLDKKVSLHLKKAWVTLKSSKTLHLQKNHYCHIMVPKSIEYVSLTKFIHVSGKNRVIYVILFVIHPVYCQQQESLCNIQNVLYLFLVMFN